MRTFRRKSSKPGRAGDVASKPVTDELAAFLSGLPGAQPNTSQPAAGPTHELTPHSSADDRGEGGAAARIAPTRDRSASDKEDTLLAFNCPVCHRALRVQRELAGRSGRCRSCGSPVKVPIIDGTVSTSSGNADRTVTTDSAEPSQPEPQTNSSGVGKSSPVSGVVVPRMRSLSGRVSFKARHPTIAVSAGLLGFYLLVFTPALFWWFPWRSASDAAIPPAIDRKTAAKALASVPEMFEAGRSAGDVLSLQNEPDYYLKQRAFAFLVRHLAGRKLSDDPVDDFLRDLMKDRNRFRRMPCWQNAPGGELGMKFSPAGTDTLAMGFEFQRPVRAWDRLVKEMALGFGTLIVLVVIAGISLRSRPRRRVKRGQV